jgi:alpha-galactosidase
MVASQAASSRANWLANKEGWPGMRWMTITLVTYFSVSLLAAQTGSAYVQAGPDRRSWKIGNGLVEREVRYSPHHGLYTESWVHKLTGTDFLRQKLPSAQPWKRDSQWRIEFEFYVDADHFAGANPGPEADFDLVGAETRDVAPHGRLLEAKLKAKKRPLDVSVFYAVYDGHPVIRKWIAVTNRGEQAIVLSRLSFEELDLQAAPPSEQVIQGYYGVQPREIFYTGRIEDPAIVEMNSRTREGFIVMNEAPGWMKRTQMINFGEGVSVMYDTDLFPFKRSLAPGQTFTSAKSGVAFCVEGRGTADPRWVMPTYTSQVLLKKGAAYQPPWFYNTWDPFTWNYDESLILGLAPIAAQMGFDIFTLDTGWSDNYNDNRVDRQKFPRGLDSVRAALASQGMGLGLWMPIAAVGPESTAYHEHPEWVMRDEEGNERILEFPEKPTRFMCLDSPYREWSAVQLNELIETYHPKYLKLDLTIVFDAYGRWRAGCFAQGHYHKDRYESLIGIYEGIQYVTDQVYQKHPDVLLDITYETWGQDHIIDYGLLRAADLDWTSNVNDESPQMAGPRQARTLLYHRGLAIPVEAMLIGNLLADMPTREERFATAIGSAPLFLGDLRKLSSDHVRWYGDKIRWFKQLRRTVPVNEGFFPLGNWLQPDALTWDGFARLSRRGEGVIAIFKNETSVKGVVVKIPTFPAGRFKVRSIMTGDLLGTITGNQFQRGTSLPMPSMYKVQLWEVRAE